MGKRIYEIQKQPMSSEKFQKHNYSKSLNMLKRRDEDRKIRAENKEFVKRIHAQKPFLTNESLTKSSSIQEDLALNISKQ